MPITKLSKKKDGLQGYRVRVNYTDRDGKYRQIERTAYGKTEALELERRLLSEAVNAPKDESSQLFSEFVASYLAYKSGEVRETSYRNSEKNLRLYILPTLGAIRLDRLSSSDVAAWKTRMNETDLSLRTKHTAFRELSAVLNYALTLKLIPENPAKAVGTFRDPYFSPAAEVLHYYTPEQFLRYIHAAESFCTRPSERCYYVFFVLAYYTGMRKGELNALKWSDVDLDSRIIHVRRSVTQKIKGRGIVETPPKNKSSYRDIGIPSVLLDVLKSHLALQHTDPHFTVDYRVCGGPNCLGDTSLSNHNIKYATAAELPVLRIHDFRHSHASLLVNYGINIQEVARRLGHADVQQTWNTYSHLYPKEEERAIAVLDGIKL